ncbi:heat-inducible transcriptional repressor HrcA [Agrococcus terreus]|uniref:Heat-inducible transcription repressor HrcA n=1 Tax=Agrococcus terreus TaxID=574649 RepID=A0ABQ2KGL0_9MICO|nr:heat-inducible transcriptional repressor HrcA [Agrococcus terreus]GGN82835.1 heat-inducible transcription repressor HrcA [Agrococcus terreus]
MVSDRGLEVLRAIVQDYVALREPVGSKSIVERHAFGVSAATIRGDMALLEEEELIVAPHTSSGRVPTDKGYRVFVDRLQRMQPLTGAQRQAIARFLEGGAQDRDEMLARTARLLSQLTNQVALVQVPVRRQALVRRVELVAIAEARVLAVLILDSGRVEQRIVDAQQMIEPEEAMALGRAFTETIAELAPAAAAERLARTAASAPPALQAATGAVARALADMLLGAGGDRLYMAGASHLVREERDFQRTVTPVLDAIEEQVTLLRLFDEMGAEGEVATRIGRELSGPLGETAVVASTYSADGSDGHIGVLGPTRMDYAGNMAAVRAVARYLTRLLSED